LLAPFDLGSILLNLISRFDRFFVPGAEVTISLSIQGVIQSIEKQPLRGDVFRRMIVSGQAEMTFELSAEAQRQFL